MKRTPFVHIFILTAFLVNILGPIPAAQAQEFRLPTPGVIVHLSPPLDPPILKGIKVHPDNPFHFDFILDKGDSVIASEAKQFQQEQLKTEATKLIKYFLASLTIPEKDLWVNLSPYEKDRIIPNSFGLTEMGRDLLAEDYMLKQITASLIYPEDEIGKKFWKRIYEEATKKFGTTNIPVNTFNKVWIVPEKAVVYENANAGTAYVVESKLKVMLEQDYLSMSKHMDVGGGSKPTLKRDGLEPSPTNINQIGSQIVREIVIPELTKEVNEDKNFSQLRQVYNSLILATWYKKKIKDSILSQVYADKNKTAGVQYDQSVILSAAKDLNKFKDFSAMPQNDTEAIYQRYLQAFKKGVYNYIKEDLDPATQETIPRKYFSGGMDLQDKAMKVAMQITSDSAALSNVNTSDLAMVTAGVNIADQALLASAEVDTLLMTKESRAPVHPLWNTKAEQRRELVKAISKRTDAQQMIALVQRLIGNLYALAPDWHYQDTLLEISTALVKGGSEDFGAFEELINSITSILKDKALNEGWTREGPYGTDFLIGVIAPLSRIQLAARADSAHRLSGLAEKLLQQQWKAKDIHSLLKVLVDGSGYGEAVKVKERRLSQLDPQRAMEIISKIKEALNRSHIAEKDQLMIIDALFSGADLEPRAEKLLSEDTFGPFIDFYKLFQEESLFGFNSPFSTLQAILRGTDIKGTVNAYVDFVDHIKVQFKDKDAPRKYFYNFFQEFAAKSKPIGSLKLYKTLITAMLDYGIDLQKIGSICQYQVTSKSSVQMVLNFINYLPKGRDDYKESILMKFVNEDILIKEFYLKMAELMQKQGVSQHMVAFHLDMFFVGGHYKTLEAFRKEEAPRRFISKILESTDNIFGQGFIQDFQGIIKSTPELMISTFEILNQLISGDKIINWNDFISKLEAVDSGDVVSILRDISGDIKRDRILTGHLLQGLIESPVLTERFSNMITEMTPFNPAPYFVHLLLMPEKIGPKDEQNGISIKEIQKNVIKELKEKVPLIELIRKTRDYLTENKLHLNLRQWRVLEGYIKESGQEGPYLHEQVLRLLMDQSSQVEEWAKYEKAKVPYVWLKDVVNVLPQESVFVAVRLAAMAGAANPEIKARDFVYYFANQFLPEEKQFALSKTSGEEPPGRSRFSARNYVEILPRPNEAPAEGYIPRVRFHKVFGTKEVQDATYGGRGFMSEFNGMNVLGRYSQGHVINVKRESDPFSPLLGEVSYDADYTALIYPTDNLGMDKQRIIAKFKHTLALSLSQMYNLLSHGKVHSVITLLMHADVNGDHRTFLFMPAETSEGYSPNGRPIRHLPSFMAHTNVRLMVGLVDGEHVVNQRSQELFWQSMFELILTFVYGGIVNGLSDEELADLFVSLKKEIKPGESTVFFSDREAFLKLIKAVRSNPNEVPASEYLPVQKILENKLLTPFETTDIPIGLFYDPQEKYSIQIIQERDSTIVQPTMSQILRVNGTTNQVTGINGVTMPKLNIALPGDKEFELFLPDEFRTKDFEELIRANLRMDRKGNDRAMRSQQTGDQAMVSHIANSKGKSLSQVLSGLNERYIQTAQEFLRERINEQDPGYARQIRAMTNEQLGDELKKFFSGYPVEDTFKPLAKSGEKFLTEFLNTLSVDVNFRHLLLIRKNALLISIIPKEIKKYNIVLREILMRWGVSGQEPNGNRARRQGDQAMRVQPENGGIDLTPTNMNVQVKTGSPTGAFRDDKGGIKFHLDPTMLQQLQNAPGFVPVIINIQPMTDLRSFLGLKEQNSIESG